MGAHALLSPSGSGRWMACPPSARLERKFPDEKSEYAAEGTFAHELAELHLKLQLGIFTKRKFNSQLKKMAENPFYSQEMIDYVQSYVDIATELINEIVAKSKDAIVLLEQRLDYSPWVPEGFGTGDLVIVSDDVLEVVDLKYGKGVPVSAEDNTQMKLYALGAINDYGVLYNVKTVRMTIVQPRLDNISSVDMPVKELLEWAENTVKPVAELAFAGEGEYKAGDHCRFCKARFTCRTRAEYNLELAKYDFEIPALLSTEEIAEVLGKADELQKWAKDIQGYALEQAKNHDIKFPGWKLVEGRSNRKYTDEDAVATTLLAADYKEGIIYKPKELFGISSLEKTIGKKQFNNLLNELIIKPAGKPTLVPESDKRPEISSVDSAIKDFE